MNGMWYLLLVKKGDCDLGFTITAAELIAFLVSKGYHKETGRGRHGVKMVLGSTRIPIPVHRRDIPKGTINDILGRAGFDPDDVIEWRGKA
jgi:predicted RNA binding protein YcfA (HicA-like mRNA interferase family)